MSNYAPSQEHPPDHPQGQGPDLDPGLSNGPGTEASHEAVHVNDAELAQTLNLDARILGSYLSEASAWAASLATRTPQSIIDVGAGSGVGTLALARQFPNASITALDKSADMLASTMAAATVQGLDGRIRTLQADLEAGWPASASADLMWASSSLHEMAEPEQIVADIFTGLQPGGLLMVIEMDGLPSFLPEAMPEGSVVGTGLELRLHEVLAGLGWNHVPQWQPVLEGVGFIVERRHFPATGTASQKLSAQYARHFIQHMHQALAVAAEPADVAALELLLGEGPESVERRGDLQVRGSRTGWAARKP